MRVYHSNIMKEIEELTAEYVKEFGKKPNYIEMTPTEFNLVIKWLQECVNPDFNCSVEDCIKYGYAVNGLKVRIIR